MAPKHKIDVDNQGSFLAPPASVAFGKLVQHEEGYFPPPPLTPEQQKSLDCLAAEHDALNSLAVESKSRGNVTNKNNVANRVAQGIYHEPAEQDLSLEDLSQAVEASTDAIQGLRLASKGSLAKSLDIEAFTEPVYEKDEDGQPVLNNADNPRIASFRIATKDPDEQARLDSAYRQFRIVYAGAKGKERRDSRREQIEQEMRSISKPSPI